MKSSGQDGSSLKWYPYTSQAGVCAEVVFSSGSIWKTMVQIRFWFKLGQVFSWMQRLWLTSFAGFNWGFNWRLSNPSATGSVSVAAAAWQGLQRAPWLHNEGQFPLFILLPQPCNTGKSNRAPSTMLISIWFLPKAVRTIWVHHQKLMQSPAAWWAEALYLNRKKTCLETIAKPSYLPQEARR